MPMENISANKDTRFSVNPYAHDANRVAASVNITAIPTTKASRRPMVSHTSTTTAVVANSSLWISFIALSSAVTP